MSIGSPTRRWRTIGAVESRQPVESTAEQRMWAYYVTELAKGRAPTGAELDRIAGTNNYGRKVLRRWRQAGDLPSIKAARAAGDLRGQWTAGGL